MGEPLGRPPSYDIVLAYEFTIKYIKLQKWHRSLISISISIYIYIYTHIFLAIPESERDAPRNHTKEAAKESHRNKHTRDLIGQARPPVMSLPFRTLNGKHAILAITKAMHMQTMLQAYSTHFPEAQHNGLDAGGARQSELG